MSLASLRTRILGELHHRPQASVEFTLAFREIEAGLAVMARLGYLYHLEPGPQPAEDEWPRLMFHVDAAPNGRLVQSRYDLPDLGDDWYLTLEEAQHADGLKTQFAGRGGIGSRNLPVVVEWSGPPSNHEADAKLRKERLIDDFRAQQTQARKDTS